MKIIAHRGYSAAAPENTLASFDAAMGAGADGIELDVTLSADGTPVVIHDDTLDRTTTGSGRVNGTSLEVLRSYDAGAWFDERFAGERIPTLAEVLELARPLELVNLELKGGRSAPAQLVARVHALLHEQGDPDQILVSSFDPRLLWKLRRRDRRWRLALLFGQKGTVSRMWRVWARSIGIDMLHPEQQLVEEVVSITHAAHRVNTWTVNDPARAATLDALGVHGVITDDPVSTREALR